MTGEQVHKCSCYDWCGSMQHQGRRAKGQGSKNLMSCCKWYMKDTDHNWHGGGDQATRAWRIPVTLSIKTTLIIKTLFIPTWHVINGAVSVETEQARWRDSYGPLNLLTTASHINALVFWLENCPIMTILNSYVNFSPFPKAYLSVSCYMGIGSETWLCKKKIFFWVLFYKLQWK